MSELLEDLREKAGCLYLSDLHSPLFRGKALGEALTLSPEAYSLVQWQEAARYLLDREDLTSVEQVRQALLGAAKGLKTP